MDAILSQQQPPILKGLRFHHITGPLGIAIAVIAALLLVSGGHPTPATVPQAPQIAGPVPLADSVPPGSDSRPRREFVVFFVISEEQAEQVRYWEWLAADGKSTKFSYLPVLLPAGQNSAIAEASLSHFAEDSSAVLRVVDLRK